MGLTPRKCENHMKAPNRIYYAIGIIVGFWMPWVSAKVFGFSLSKANGFGLAGGMPFSILGSEEEMLFDAQQLLLVVPVAAALFIVTSFFPKSPTRNKIQIIAVLSIVIGFGISVINIYNQWEGKYKGGLGGWSVDIGFWLTLFSIILLSVESINAFVSSARGDF